ncbi:MAG TPA: SAM-dependent DNA methyltransferase, partial [Chloroflexota bacterium]|nr:SAM-dependent DNA methyltransferase [Chloroflexota bacterium]
ARKELTAARGAYASDRDELLKQIGAFGAAFGKTPAENDAQHAARKAFDPIAERAKGLIRQVDLISKLSARACDAAEVVAKGERAAEHLDRRELSKKLKALDAARVGTDDRQPDGSVTRRTGAVEQLKLAAYYHRQIAWLQDRFPEATFLAVPGLVKAVDLKEIEAADWSLTPGRYVGVAASETDEDFDFEQSINEIHVELMSLNEEAVTLSSEIARNFVELGA